MTFERSDPRSEDGDTMAVVTETIELDTPGEVQLVDITGDVQSAVTASGLSAGMVCVFNPGSTGAITTIEHEPGLLKDIPEALERLFPRGITYHHDQTWHDGNGHSHVRAAVLGPGLTVPFVGGRLTLGTWQQIVHIELDNKPHHRRLVVQMVGE
jgi:secondary thiamine-phosphate synthase enzyme